MRTAPEGLSPGAAAASACSRLPGNHSAGQGSRKPRRRIHVSGPLGRLAIGHLSMVRRCQKPGNCISGAFRDAVPGPGDDGARIPDTGGCGLSVRRLAVRRETGCHSGTARTETYAVDAAVMLLERNAACLIGAAGRPETGHSVR